MNDSQDIKAEVIAVFPDKVKISVGNISAFASVVFRSVWNLTASSPE